LLHLILTIIGFFPLIYGANLLVESASSLAFRLRIPPLVIGLTIVAFGTSAPEMVVNVLASLSGSSQIVMGNIIGSNIANILLILGLSSIIFPIGVGKSTTWIEIPLSLLSVVILLFLANDRFFGEGPVSAITFLDGVVLLAFFLVFLSYTISLSLSKGPDQSIEVKSYSIGLACFLLILGIGLLVLGGKVIVDNATAFARNLGISERIIGLTIISIGTSLPELATSIIAATKKQADIAIGNVVGSNIFNVFFILGLSALIAPIEGSFQVNIDLTVNVIACLALFLFIFTGKGRRIERWEGILLFGFYGGYLGYLILS
jgi:cation:H+ antiporter